jgi:phage terminase large subunit-like protein
MWQRAKEDNVPYPHWVEQGMVIATPSNIIDYDYIFRQFVDEIAPLYSIQEIGFDPYNAAQFSLGLQSAGFRCVEVRQGAQTMSEPAKIFEALIKAGRIRHAGHPVLRWCVSNVAAREDKKENIFPYKQHARKRIDGAIASIIALSRLMVGGSQAVSIYESRGPIFV